MPGDARLQCGRSPWLFPHDYRSAPAILIAMACGCIATVAASASQPRKPVTDKANEAPARTAAHKPPVKLGEPTPGDGLMIATTALRSNETKRVLTLDRRVTKFRKIAVRTSGRSVFVETITIVYDDGTRSLENFGVKLFRNTRSRWFSSVSDHFIRSIEVRYREAKGRGGSGTTLTFFGKAADRWLVPSSRATSLNDGWVLLASRQRA